MKHYLPRPIDPSNESAFDAVNEPIMGDCMNGRYTAEERLSLGLLQLLHKISAPKCVYASIMVLFADATQAKVTLPLHFAPELLPSNILQLGFGLNLCIPQQ